MDIVRNKLVPKKTQLKKLINELYKRYPQGFYVHAKYYLGMQALTVRSK